MDSSENGHRGRDSPFPGRIFNIGHDRYAAAVDFIAEPVLAPCRFNL